MADTERKNGLDGIRNFEQRVLEEQITREELEKIEDDVLGPDLTIGEYVEISIEYKKFVWNRKGHLMPDYSNATNRLSLDIGTLSALRRKSREEGKMPEDILTSIIKKAL